MYLNKINTWLLTHQNLCLARWTGSQFSPRGVGASNERYMRSRSTAAHFWTSEPRKSSCGRRSESNLWNWGAKVPGCSISACQDVDGNIAGIVIKVPSVAIPSVICRTKTSVNRLASRAIENASPVGFKRKEQCCSRHVNIASGHLVGAEGTRCLGTHHQASDGQATDSESSGRHFDKYWELTYENVENWGKIVWNGSPRATFWSIGGGGLLRRVTSKGIRTILPLGLVHVWLHVGVLVLANAGWSQTTRSAGTPAVGGKERSRNSKAPIYNVDTVKNVHAHALDYIRLWKPVRQMHPEWLLFHHSCLISRFLPHWYSPNNVMFGSSSGFSLRRRFLRTRLPGASEAGSVSFAHNHASNVFLSAIDLKILQQKQLCNQHNSSF